MTSEDFINSIKKDLPELRILKPKYAASSSFLKKLFDLNEKRVMPEVDFNDGEAQQHTDLESLIFDMVHRHNFSYNKQHKVLMCDSADSTIVISLFHEEDVQFYKLFVSGLDDDYRELKTIIDSL